MKCNNHLLFIKANIRQLLNIKAKLDGNDKSLSLPIHYVMKDRNILCHNKTLPLNHVLIPCTSTQPTETLPHYDTQTSSVSCRLTWKLGLQK